MVRERVLSGANDVRAGAEQELRDSGVRGAKAWVLRALLAVTSVALLATSPGDEYFYHFEAASEGTVTLTSDEPHASFVVTVRAIALGPDGVDSTRQATSRLQGVITTEGATGRFVSVGVGDGTEPDPDEALEVATEVTLSRSLTFEGNCADPTQGEPCVAELFLDFERTDGGDGGGAVTIDWVLDLESRFHKSDSPNVGPVEAPWTVEVTPR